MQAHGEVPVLGLRQVEEQGQAHGEVPVLSWRQAEEQGQALQEWCIVQLLGKVAWWCTVCPMKQLAAHC